VLTREEFDTLAVGDLVETRGLFPKLSPEPVVLRVGDRGKEHVDFVATYFGVTLGKWVCVAKEGELKWAF
jgi:hypothetical protein